jgi:hypothetical protein
MKRKASERAKKVIKHQYNDPFDIKKLGFNPFGDEEIQVHTPGDGSDDEFHLRTPKIAGRVLIIKPTRYKLPVEFDENAITTKIENDIMKQANELKVCKKMKKRILQGLRKTTRKYFYFHKDSSDEVAKRKGILEGLERLSYHELSESFSPWKIKKAPKKLIKKRKKNIDYIISKAKSTKRSFVDNKLVSETKHQISNNKKKSFKPKKVNESLWAQKHSLFNQHHPVQEKELTVPKLPLYSEECFIFSSDSFVLMNIYPIVKQSPGMKEFNVLVFGKTFTHFNTFNSDCNEKFQLEDLFDSFLMGSISNSFFLSENKESFENSLKLISYIVRYFSTSTQISMILFDKIKTLFSYVFTYENLQKHRDSLSLFLNFRLYCLEWNSLLFNVLSGPLDFFDPYNLFMSTTDLLLDIHLLNFSLFSPSSSFIIIDLNTHSPLNLDYVICQIWISLCILCQYRDISFWNIFNSCVLRKLESENNDSNSANVKLMSYVLYLVILLYNTVQFSVCNWELLTTLWNRCTTEKRKTLPRAFVVLYAMLGRFWKIEDSSNTLIEIVRSIPLVLDFKITKDSYNSDVNNYIKKINSNSEDIENVDPIIFFVKFMKRVFENLYA